MAVTEGRYSKKKGKKVRDEKVPDIYRSLWAMYVI